MISIGHEQMKKKKHFDILHTRCFIQDSVEERVRSVRPQQRWTSRSVTPSHLNTAKIQNKNKKGVATYETPFVSLYLIYKNKIGYI